MGLALALRCAILPLAPVYGYPWDHDDMVRWGIQAADRGLLTLYDVPAPRNDLSFYQNGQRVVVQRSVDRYFVYPPLLAYPVYLGGMAHKWLSPDRMGNTLTSRSVYSAIAILGDIALAFGCAALAIALGTATAGRWAFVLALFAPPIWLDSSLWGQVDSTMLAPLVWMLWAMSRARWRTAGVLFGMALMFKPLAIVLSPVWLLALLTVRPVWRPLQGLGIAAITIALVSLPFTLHSGSAWWRFSYLANVTTEFPATTLKAFNVWYAEALTHQTLDVSRRWGGLSMDAWGRAALCVSLIAGLVGVVRRWGGRPQGLVMWAGMVALLSVMLATRVHDRYLLLALPFLIISATWYRRLVVALVPLLLVATAQLSWTYWLRSEPGGWDRIAAATRAQHDQTLAALPPAEQAQVRPLEQYLAVARQQYLDERRRTEPIEWALVVLALAGTAMFMRGALARDEPAEMKPGRGVSPVVRRRGARARERAFSGR